ncbi:hypothetical protein EDF81_2167 [Enterobacter sp. BIGb0383]|uniref:hypothetical protein n=1 Tax=unclassified Enterobacter TaxID=2608935 RepID=UPI000F460920|nr:MULTISPECIES: hypothetical protein [unclassified Enterobacter]ROP59368.1 hypothetical protein EDF81_2167 [Enterobacter sp. BIGb0383]ROS09166.1 hypothetical protein EC848_2673 [Enterobacter sp. BIGb0359]
MKFSAIIFALFTFLFVFSSGTTLAKQQTTSDDKIKQLIIEESIAAYPGVCACPFNRARNGSSCGRRSAWSKAGGYSPVCYKDEVTQEMVREWRDRN